MAERNILFLCTGNSARSQMGEALLRKHAGHYFKVFSAGLTPQEEIFPPVIEVMKEIGIDLSMQKPKGIAEFLGKIHFEKVIIVCSHADENCPSIFGSSQRLRWPFDDPAKATGTSEEILSKTRKIRNEMEQHIIDWLNEQDLHG
jgi:arsenate reductase (thioredoxin)